MMEFPALFLIREVEKIVDVRRSSGVWGNMREEMLEEAQRKRILEVVT
jgi:hypothetical protein